MTDQTQPLTKERYMQIHSIRPDEVAHVVDSNGDQPECIDDCPGCEPKPFAYTCTDGAHRLTITPDPDARDYYGDIRPIVEVAITDVTDDDAEPAVVSVWGPDAGTVATAIRTAGRVSLGETEPKATADNPDDDALIQALSDAGAICGDCGSEPGDRYCEHCERARRWYVDAARKAGWAPVAATGHPLDDMTPQTCPAGLHADWAVDSESTHTCPWCENERLRTRVAELEARPDRATVLRDAADAIDRRSDISAAIHATAELRRLADREPVHPDAATTSTEYGVRWDNPTYGTPDWFAYSERVHAETVLADGGGHGHVVTRTTTRTEWRPADEDAP